ncbi:hypothetical protein COY05_01500 [Candidatus Peregrinibacteria bacterium CG_4_10_14_0_2_um_filter_38_24]|nr:MAG: hypothetical protein COY05_01500 [Candidatus Peregrinibacteria bacterium CG_4_10_14_0_2_um_filter_38_24]
MENFFKALAQSKLPSILIIGIFLSIGFFLVKDQPLSFTPSLIWGSFFLILGIILGLLSYSDHRNKEHTDKLLKYYQDALDAVSKTHSSFETKTQTELTNNSSVSKLSSGYTAQSADTKTQDS